MVRVTAGGYADPGDAPAGASADAGERLVTLELRVTAEGPEGTAAIRVPFEKADSFLLIAEDDTITVAQLGDDALLGATLRPGEPLGTTLAFSVGDVAQLRFVCTPAEGSQPRSATWELRRSRRRPARTDCSTEDVQVVDPERRDLAHHEPRRLRDRRRSAGRHREHGRAFSLVGELDARQVVVLAHGQGASDAPPPRRTGRESRTVASVFTPGRIDDDVLCGHAGLHGHVAHDQRLVEAAVPHSAGDEDLLDQAVLVEADRRVHAVAERRGGAAVLVDLGAEHHDDLGRRAGSRSSRRRRPARAGTRGRRRPRSRRGRRPRRAAGASAPAAGARPRR